MGICQMKPQDKQTKDTLQKVSKVTPKGAANRGKREISRKYKFGSVVLGIGQYGKVFLAENKNDSKQKVAVKALSKKKLGKLIDKLKQEVIFLRRLDSPNIVKYYETYEDEEYVYLVMEYCPGGELFDLISQKLEKSKKFKEKEAAELMQKLFKAVSHVHSQGIAHRDIKPENIMIGREGELKLIDFGLAQKFVKNNRLDIGKMVGTPQYLAPEAFEGISSMEVDLWSLGVLMCVLLSGSYPYAGASPEELLRSIYDKPEIKFETKVWKRVSQNGKDLVRQLLQIDPKKRIQAKDALQHPWFNKYCPVITLLSENVTRNSSSNIQQDQIQGLRRQSTQFDDTLDPDVILNLQKFSQGTSKFKKAALNVLVKTISGREIEHLKRQFEMVDVNHTGLIDAEELMNGIKAAGIDVKPEEVDKIIESVNFKGNGEINYSEFIAATISIQEIMTNERIYALFKEFDHEDIEVLTIHNIKGAMKRMGKDITNEEIEHMLSEHNVPKDGFIDFEKFKEIILSNDKLNIIIK
ncbi:protein kinase domain containing protein [Stylonychia lemnae]|uniref:non-specific serine/threonine protein kinase n=1 Tax=Stylonychia lemnae TaxID=5949 RepID=A0A078BBE5_STYLE|nr:protein kinase domain containing protein [Stylonychia lemnae]|eukprot:CDW90587.1 protein kinase domain containing protein [Stylonychia lemnae]